MKTSRILASLALISLVACSKPANKKVLVIGRGTLTVNENTITMNDGSGYAEQTVEVAGEEPVVYNVTAPAGKSTVTVPQEAGFYIVNLKTDTLVGSQQILGTDISSSRVITQEELKVKIDSLTKLTAGQNASAAAHSYFILPNHVSKISSNMEAQVFGPFTKIPSTLTKDKNGNMPEIYKFYTNTEMRQVINNLKKNTF